jgi:hypothetical protein
MYLVETLVSVSDKVPDDFFATANSVSDRLLLFA